MLELLWASLTSAETEQLFYFLCSSSNCDTIKNLTIAEACNFDTDKACEHLAELIATAPEL